MTAHRVVFTPSGKRGDFADGTSLLAAARTLGVDLEFGLRRARHLRALSGRNRRGAVRQARDRVARADHASPWNEVEQRYVDKRGPLAPARRLGCQAKLCGDLVVDVPAESQVHRQVVRKRAEEHPIEIDPVVRLHYVEVREPDMREPSSDFRRLQEALAEQWGVAGAAADLATLKSLQKILRAGHWKATVAVRKGATS